MRNPRASSPQKLLEKGRNAFPPLGLTWKSIKEVDLSYRAALFIVCSLTQDKRSFILASCQLVRGALLPKAIWSNNRVYIL